jgi:hypothetical protein
MRKTPFKHAHNSRGSSCGGGRGGAKRVGRVVESKKLEFSVD